MQRRRRYSVSRCTLNTVGTVLTSAFDFFADEYKTIFETRKERERNSFVFCRVEIRNKTQAGNIHYFACRWPFCRPGVRLPLGGSQMEFAERGGAGENSLKGAHTGHSYRRRLRPAAKKCADHSFGSILECLLHFRTRLTSAVT